MKNQENLTPDDKDLSQNVWFEVTVKVRDPLVARLIKQLADRSNAGAEEYGCNSILDRVNDPVELIAESIEETLDKAVYLMAAKMCLLSPRG